MWSDVAIPAAGSSTRSGEPGEHRRPAEPAVTQGSSGLFRCCPLIRDERSSIASQLEFGTYILSGQLGEFAHGFELETWVTDCLEETVSG
jgi:hypothetical protein